MNNSFSNVLRLRFVYLVIWVILAIAQIFLLYYYFPDKNTYEQYILYDTIVCNILQVGCIWLLWYPVKYFSSTWNIPFILLFHAALFLFFAATGMGLGYLITYNLLLPYPHYTEFFLNLLPVRIAFSLLIYVSFVLAYYLLLNHDKLKVQKQIIEKKEAASFPVPIEKLSRIIVKKHSEFHCITVNQIRYIEANGDYVLIYADSGRYLKDQPMKYWETHLPDDYFVRIHRSFIVNIEEVAKIEVYEKETYKVHLKNGDTLKASSAGYKLLKQKMR